MNRSVLFFILPAILLLIDWYVFQAVKTLSRSATEGTQRIIAIAFWGFTAVSLLLYVIMQLLPPTLSAVTRARFCGHLSQYRISRKSLQYLLF